MKQTDKIAQVLLILATLIIIPVAFFSKTIGQAVVLGIITGLLGTLAFFWKSLTQKNPEHRPLTQPLAQYVNTPAPVKYGINVPPDCEEIVFSGMKEYHTYTSFSNSIGPYNVLTVKLSPETEVEFKKRTDYSACLAQNKTKGVISR